MGQKTHPIGFRLQINHTWNSRWYSSKKFYPTVLNQDVWLREYIRKNFKEALISKIIIERVNGKCDLFIYLVKSRIIIGKSGEIIKNLKKTIERKINLPISINLFEIKKIGLDSRIVAADVVSQLEKRIPFKKAIKRAISNTMRMDAKGIKISCSGRLNGAEIARTESFSEGRLPLHNIKADIDYYCDVAVTTYGTCGVKVWIYRGDISKYDPKVYDKILC